MCWPLLSYPQDFVLEGEFILGTLADLVAEKGVVLLELKHSCWGWDPDAGGVTQLVVSCPARMRSWVQSPASHQRDKMAHTCNPSTWGLEGEEFTITMSCVESLSPVWTTGFCPKTAKKQTTLFAKGSFSACLPQVGSPIRHASLAILTVMTCDVHSGVQLLCRWSD